MTITAGTPVKVLQDFRFAGRKGTVTRVRHHADNEVSYYVSLPVSVDGEPVIRVTGPWGADELEVIESPA